MTALIVFETVIICLIITTMIIWFAAEEIIRYRRKRKIFSKSFPIFSDSFEQYNFKVPKGLYFDKSHTWSFMDNDGLVKIGVDDFFPHLIGELTSINLKKSGEKIKKNEVFLSLFQNGKRLDIKAPISGMIKTQNNRLANDTSLINSSPYEKGWVYIVEPTNWLNEIGVFFMAEKFSTWLRAEFARLKDFLAVNQSSNLIGISDASLQDGGMLKAGILKDFKSDVWQKLQKNFIDIIN